MIARFSVIPRLEKVAIAFALSLALFLAALAAFLYWYWSTYIEDYQDWPPLTMTYSETSGAPTVYRLTHRTKTDWREEIIQDPLMPTMVASYHEVDDGQVSFFNAETGELETSPGSFGASLGNESGPLRGPQGQLPGYPNPGPDEHPPVLRGAVQGQCLGLEIRRPHLRGRHEGHPHWRRHR